MTSTNNKTKTANNYMTKYLIIIVLYNIILFFKK